MALLDASESCYWLSHIINEWMNEPLSKTLIFTDNRSLADAAHSTTSVEEKRLRVDLSAFRESITNNEFELRWVDTRNQHLTKQGADSTKLLDTLFNGRL